MAEDVFALLRKRRETEYRKSDDEIKAEAEKERKHQEHLAKRRAQWAEQKDEINAKRRDRYSSDPEYREKRKSENHEGYESNRAVRIMKATAAASKAREKDPQKFLEDHRRYALKTKAKRMADPEKHADIIAANKRYYNKNRDAICAKKRENRRLKKETENAQRIELCNNVA